MFNFTKVLQYSFFNKDNTFSLSRLFFFQNKFVFDEIGTQGLPLTKRVLKPTDRATETSLIFYHLPTHKKHTHTKKKKKRPKVCSSYLKGPQSTFIRTEKKKEY